MDCGLSKLLASRWLLSSGIEVGQWRLRCRRLHWSALTHVVAADLLLLIGDLSQDPSRMAIGLLRRGAILQPPNGGIAFNSSFAMTRIVDYVIVLRAAVVQLPACLWVQLVQFAVGHLR